MNEKHVLTIDRFYIPRIRFLTNPISCLFIEIATQLKTIFQKSTEKLSIQKYQDVCNPLNEFGPLLPYSSLVHPFFALSHKLFGIGFGCISISLLRASAPAVESSVRGQTIINDTENKRTSRKEHRRQPRFGIQLVKIPVGLRGKRSTASHPLNGVLQTERGDDPASSRRGLNVTARDFIYGTKGGN